MHIAPEEVGKPLDYYRPRGPFTRKPGRLAMLALRDANDRALWYFDQTLECECHGYTANTVDSGWYDYDKDGRRVFYCD